MVTKHEEIAETLAAIAKGNARPQILDTLRKQLNDVPTTSYWVTLTQAMRTANKKGTGDARANRLSRRENRS